ncbi:MAG: threonyl-tRNA synthetase [Parcubacteria group bacterium Gr01-1014_72]|nr:MAG: threonyl-tRNA synthetase [Parcubacteria group bacterium Gr01-1014_72]
MGYLDASSRNATVVLSLPYTSSLYVYFFLILTFMDSGEQKYQDRDHRKIGRELDLFAFSDTVGKGLPLWTERGAAIRRELERFIVDEEIRRGYKHVYTPDIAKLDLYKKSGHYPYFKDSMYAPLTIDGEEFMLRPMTCPHHFELYLSRPRSYRELPIRYAELAKLYRYELSGVLSGLVRVRTFCLADAHIVCADKEQAAAEIKSALELIEYMAGVFGLKKGEDFWYRLSLGDRNDEKKYFKDDAAWDEAETLLRETLQAHGEKFVEAENEAAFYGPKIDIQMKDVRGVENTAFTVQYDFVMPKRFRLTYTASDGTEKEPVVIHRSSVGAIERIIAFLIEHYDGAFPLWLAPVQVKVLSVSEKHSAYAKKVHEALRAADIRSELDDSDESLGKKVRTAKLEKVPYWIVVGEKEETTQTVSLNQRTGGEVVVLAQKDLIDRLALERDAKK